MRLLGDDDRARRAARESALRAAGRSADGLLPSLDSTVLLRSAHDHAVRLTTARDGPSSASAVTDLAVLDLVVRRGLDPRTVATVTGVPRREHAERRARAATVLAGQDTTPAEAERSYAAAPLDRAPHDVRATVAAALDTEPGHRAPRRPWTRIAGTAALAAVALVGIAASTPTVLDRTADSPRPVTGEIVEYVPVSSTIADAGAAEDGERAPGTDGTSATEDGEVLLPRGDEGSAPSSNTDEPLFGDGSDDG